MKKITKKDLRGLKQLFPMLGKAEMRHYVGGYSNGYWNGNWNNPYSLIVFRSVEQPKTIRNIQT